MVQTMFPPSPDGGEDSYLRTSAAGRGAGGGGLTSRGRVRKALDGREPDRVPIFDIYPGEPEVMAAGWLPPTTGESAVCLLSVDFTPRYPVQVLEQDGNAIVQTTPYGGVRRVSANLAWPSRVVDYPVKSRADWEYVAPRLEATPDRVDWTAVRSAVEQARTTGRCVALAAPVGVAACAAYLGAPSVLDMLGADPSFIRAMADTHASLLCGLASLLLAGGCELDLVVLFDDLANRRGLLFPPSHYRRVLAPVGRRLADFFHGLGLKVILYAGGDLRLLIPDLLDTGLDGLGPLEAAAGMDLPILKLNYGADLALLGGIDRRALQHPDPAVLEREIAIKLRAGMVNGRYIGGFDGPLPATMPAEQYARAAELLATYGKY
jgi:uroporphyrinogen decarboxylase